VAGLALHYQKNETAKNTSIASAFKNCSYRKKKVASESHAGKKFVFPFFQFF
jgi:hypothetical protein